MGCSQAQLTRLPDWGRMGQSRVGMTLVTYLCWRRWEFNSPSAATRKRAGDRAVRPAHPFVRPTR
jgi:hypothetical protein